MSCDEQRKAIIIAGTGWLQSSMQLFGKYTSCQWLSCCRVTQYDAGPISKLNLYHACSFTVIIDLEIIEIQLRVFETEKKVGTVLARLYTCAYYIFSTFLTNSHSDCFILFLIVSVSSVILLIACILLIMAQGR